jgi:hypothetical protein
MHTEPFFIMHKSAHDRIRSRVEGTDSAFCQAVYSSLRRLANDACLPEGPVELTINQIASGAGCSYRKAAMSLQLLKNEGLVRIESRKIPGTSGQLPCIYSFGTIGLTSGTIGQTLGTEPPSFSAEIKKEHKEQKESWAKSPSANGPRAKSSNQTSATQPKRPANLLLESLAGTDGSTISEITPSGWKGFQRALSEIKGVCPEVTPDEIRRRAGNYRRHFPDAAISAHALAKHWSRCQSPPPEGPAFRRREAGVKQIDLTTSPTLYP